MASSRHLLSWIVPAAVLFSAFNNNINDVDAADVAVVDLSQDLQDDPLLNLSPGAVAVNEAASNDPFLRTALVLQHGKIVSSYVRDDVDSKVPFQVWSTTKSWTSLLAGYLVQDGLLSLDDTLGEIFPNDDQWANATDADIRKAVTIRELLTMSSGLISPPVTPEQMAAYLADMEAARSSAFEGGIAGGSSLDDSLAFPAIGEKGEFSYLGVSNILSYIIVELTGGLTPRQYLAEKVLPDLGIDDADINWWKNIDGVEYAYHGLELTPHQMAKFGQLYLQNGKASSNKQLISEDWAKESLTPHMSFTTEFIPGIPLEATYGYLFWSGGETDGKIMNIPGIGNIWCAIGAGGQDICIDANLGRVSVQQRDMDLAQPMSGSLVIAPAAFDPALSFETKAEPAATGPSSTNGDSETVSENDNSTTTPGTTEEDNTTSGTGSLKGRHCIMSFLLVVAAAVLL